VEEVVVADNGSVAGAENTSPASGSHGRRTGTHGTGGGSARA